MVAAPTTLGNSPEGSNRRALPPTAQRPSCGIVAKALLFFVAVGEGIPLGHPNPSLFFVGCAAVVVVAWPWAIRVPRLGVWIAAGFFGTLTNLIVIQQTKTFHFADVVAYLPLRLAVLLTGIALMCQVRGITPYRLLGVVAGGYALYGSLASLHGVHNAAYMWKYYLAYPVTIIALMLGERHVRLRSVYTLLGLTLGAISLLSGFRSQGGIVIAAVLFWRLVNSTRVARNKPKRLKTVVMLAIVVLTALTLFPHAAASGWLGHHVENSFRSNATNGTNLLLAGRPETVISVATIAEKPLLGWGGIPPTSSALLQRAIDLAPNFGVAATPSVIQIWSPSGSVSPHSILGATWIEAGLPGALLCLALLYSAVRFLWKQARGAARAPAAVIYVSLQLVWELLFSPLTYGVDALLAVAILLWLPKSKSRHLR